MECGYLAPGKGSLLLDGCKEICRLLGGMMAKADLFCGKPPKALREDGIGYFVDQSKDPA